MTDKPDTTKDGPVPERRKHLVGVWQAAVLNLWKAEDAALNARIELEAASDALDAEGFNPWGSEIPNRAEYESGR